MGADVAGPSPRKLYLPERPPMFANQTSPDPVRSPQAVHHMMGRRMTCVEPPLVYSLWIDGIIGVLQRCRFAS